MQCDKLLYRRGPRRKRGLTGDNLYHVMGIEVSMVQMSVKLLRVGVELDPSGL